MCPTALAYVGRIHVPVAILGRGLMSCGAQGEAYCCAFSMNSMAATLHNDAVIVSSAEELHRRYGDFLFALAAQSPTAYLLMSVLKAWTPAFYVPDEVLTEWFVMYYDSDLVNSTRHLEPKYGDNDQMQGQMWGGIGKLAKQSIRAGQRRRRKFVLMSNGRSHALPIEPCQELLPVYIKQNAANNTGPAH